MEGQMDEDVGNAATLMVLHLHTLEEPDIVHVVGCVVTFSFLQADDQFVL
jgi:hypothetical protein